MKHLLYILPLLLLPASGWGQAITCHAAGCPIATAKVRAALHDIDFVSAISILDQDQWTVYKKAWKVSDRQTIAFTNPAAHITYLRLGWVLDADVDGSPDSIRQNLLHELGHMTCGMDEKCADSFRFR